MDVKQKLTDINLYVTSDTHFYHNKEFIYKNRGYDDPIQMNEDMINTINSTVGTDGVLLHLGDFCLNTKINQYYEILNKLKIKELWLINGNHNNPHRNLEYREIDVPYQIKHLGDYFTFKYNKKYFVCCHFPLRMWDGQSNGSMHIHGHCHNNLISSRSDDKTQKILDVGWDAFSRPIHINEVLTIMNTKKINSEHHDRDLHLSPCHLV